MPPPISTIKFPLAFSICNPAPKAAMIGNSIKKTSFTPADITASSTAFFSTSVMPIGMPIITRGRDMFIR